jgi:hypothetical protein
MDWLIARQCLERIKALAGGVNIIGLWHCHSPSRLE